MDDGGTRIRTKTPGINEPSVSTMTMQSGVKLRYPILSSSTDSTQPTMTFISDSNRSDVKRSIWVRQTVSRVDVGLIRAKKLAPVVNNILRLHRLAALGFDRRTAIWPTTAPPAPSNSSSTTSATTPPTNPPPGTAVTPTNQIFVGVAVIRPLRSRNRGPGGRGYAARGRTGRCGGRRGRSTSGSTGSRRNAAVRAGTVRACCAPSRAR